MQACDNEHGQSLKRTIGFVVLLIAVACGAYFIGSRPGPAPNNDFLVASTRLSTVRAALELFRADVGRFPTSSEGLSILATPAGRGPYVSASELVDPWGSPLVYDYHDEGVPTVVCWGADRQAGGTSTGADMYARPLVATGPASRNAE